MVNFFSYFLTCSNTSTINDVVGKLEISENSYTVFSYYVEAAAMLVLVCSRKHLR